MKRNKQETILLLSLLCITLFLLIDSREVIEAVLFAFQIWKEKLFPCLFPFLTISTLLIQYGFVTLLGTKLAPLFRRLFHIRGEGAFVLLLSMLSGFPSSAKYISTLLEENKINEKEGAFLLSICHFANPLFLIGTVITLLLKDKALLLPLLLAHYLPNFLLGLFLRPKKLPEKQKQEKISSKTSLSFGENLTDAINSSFRTLFLILGILILFLVLQVIITTHLPLSDQSKMFISGILEMSQGVTKVGMSALPILVKGSLIVFFLSFGGFSIHMQIFSILSKTKIKYQPYFLIRLIHGILSVLFFLLFTN